MNRYNTEKTRLSILLVTYNHEKFIRKAMDSIFKQDIKKPIELVIADDASSDETLSIIKEYEGKDARIKFRYLDSSVNLGITKNYQRGFSACLSEYIAILEGDDYWVSPKKLLRQEFFLDNHWECDLCSVNYFVYEEYQSNFYPRTTVGEGYRLVSARELIADNLVGNFSTCMYRKSALEKLPNNLFEICSYDWIVNICVARDSLIGFLEEPMSVYRLHTNGVWSQTPFVEQLKKQLELIPEYDLLTEKVFQKEFHILSKKLKHAVYGSQVTDVTSVISLPIIEFSKRLVEFSPPVLLLVFRVLTPPILKKIILKIIQRGAS